MSADPKKPKAAREVRVNELSRENPTRTYKEPGGWIRSPGMLELFRAAEWEFLRVAELRGMLTLELTHLRVANLPGESRIYLYPTTKGDKDRLALKRAGNRLRVNLGPVLTKWKLAIPLHHRERFDLFLAEGDESPVGPALYLDLAKPAEVKVTGQKGESPAAQSAPGAAPPGAGSGPISEQ